MFRRRRGYKWLHNWHHERICEALMRVYRGETTRLIINIPPRYSKTQLAVVDFMAWTLGKNPDSEFIHVSYSGALAANNAWQAREVVSHEDYRELFPGVSMLGDSTAKAHWKTTAGGVVYAVGAGGTITGFGAGKQRDGFAGAIIVDDPHKADEANSDTVRQGVLEWFQNTLESRKNSRHTPIIVVMQRLHEDDLSGWLLEGGNGEKWEHLCIPAINDGDALWPEKHSIDELRRMEQASPYVFAGQYMQSPSPAEGGLFKPNQMEILPAIPVGQIQWARGWDLASITNGGDWTVGVRIGRMADGRFIVADVERFQSGPDARDRAIRNTVAADGHRVRQSLPQDPGQAGKTQSIYLARQMPGYTVKFSPETGDKITRSEPFAAQVNVGNVLMLEGPWNKAFTDEMKMFPNGRYDDQVDAASRAFAELIAPMKLNISEEAISAY